MKLILKLFPYTMINGVLDKKGHNLVLIYVLDLIFVKKVIIEMHNGVICGHFIQDITTKDIRCKILVVYST